MIKLIDYKPYGTKEVFISKAMIQSMKRDDDMTYIAMCGGCSYNVKEAPEEILAMPDIEEGNKVIDLTKILKDNTKITIGTKIRLKTNPDVILNIISDDCHYDKFECSNGSVLSLKQIEKYYDII